jgi:hypothetical protein
MTRPLSAVPASLDLVQDFQEKSNQEPEQTDAAKYKEEHRRNRQSRDRQKDEETRSEQDS